MSKPTLARYLRTTQPGGENLGTRTTKRAGPVFSNCSRAANMPEMDEGCRDLQQFSKLAIGTLQVDVDSPQWKLKNH